MQTAWDGSDVCGKTYYQYMQNEKYLGFANTNKKRHKALRRFLKAEEVGYSTDVVNSGCIYQVSQYKGSQRHLSAPSLCAFTNPME